MKLLTRSIAVSALILAIASPAAAATSGSSNLSLELNRAAGPNSNVRFAVNGDTITLYGFVSDRYFLNRVNQVAKSSGFTNIRNSIVRSN